MKEFQINGLVYYLVLVFNLIKDFFSHLYVSNLDFYLNQFNKSGVTLVLDTSTVSFNPPIFPVIVKHVRNVEIEINGYIYHNFESRFVIPRSYNSVPQFQHYAFFFLLYDHRMVSEQICNFHYPCSKFTAAEIFILSPNSTFRHWCRGSPMTLELEMDSNGYEYKVVGAFLNSHFSNCTFSQLSACFIQQMQYSQPAPHSALMKT